MRTYRPQPSSLGRNLFRPVAADRRLWQPEDGDRTLGLNGSGPGAIAQTFATVPGAVYDVSFWMAGEPFTDPAIKHLRVSADGQSADYSFDSSVAWHWSMGWEQHTFEFTANDNAATLTFQSLDAGRARSRRGRSTAARAPSRSTPASWVA